jgi:hypothetical protein
MPNDPANDRYNPQGIGSTDFDYFRFSDLPMEELFWLSDDTSSPKNTAYRKISETQGQNTKTREIFTMDGKAHTYQKI